MASRRGPRPPAAVRVVLPELSPEVSPTADGRYDAALLTDLDLSGVDLTGAAFDGCLLERVALHEAGLRAVHLVECELRQLDAASVDLPRSGWRDVLLSGSRLGAAEAYESVWRGVGVSDTKIGYLNARGATWTDVAFDGCTLDDLDLGGAKVTRLSLAGCRVGTLRLGGHGLTDVDLRGAELGAVEGLDGLAGCWVSEHQLAELAPLLARHLGLGVA